MTPSDVKEGTRATGHDEVEIGVEIDPRIQERREEVHREANEKRRRIAVLVAGGVIGLGLLYVAIQSPAVDVDHIQVRGNTHVSADAVRKAAQVDLGAPMLFVDTDAVARRVRALEWVSFADVRRDFPGTLRITVREEDPVAFARRNDGRVVLFSSEGRVIAIAETVPPGVTEVRGVRKAPEIGGMLSPPEAAGVVRALPSQLANQVVAIDIGGVGVALDLARGGEVRLGDLTDLDATAAAIAVLARWGDEPLSYVDVSVPQNPTRALTRDGACERVARASLASSN